MDACAELHVQLPTMSSGWTKTDQIEKLLGDDLVREKPQIGKKRDVLVFRLVHRRDFNTCANFPTSDMPKRLVVACLFGTPLSSSRFKIVC